MYKNKKICVIGGDFRQIHMMKTLIKNGYEVIDLFLNQDEKKRDEIIPKSMVLAAFEKCDIIVFPLPVTTNGDTVHASFCTQKISIRECINLIAETVDYRKKLVLGGKIEQEVCDYAKQRNITLIDYLEREELAVLNAVPTAEGAIEIAMRELPTTIFGTKVLLTGFGRISKVLLKILTALGADVTVAVRKKSDLAWIKIFGGKGILISEISEKVKSFNLIYNTVPAMLFNESTLSKINRDCLVIDLASKPGGVDFDMAMEKEIKTIWALSLPGKVAPISAGEIIADSVLNIIEEKGGTLE